jgi:hypothetical protein
MHLLFALDEWWLTYGCSAPNLQKLAIRVLSQTCSASGCERNWSLFEHIHSKKRNRLEHQVMNDMAYVQCNSRLQQKYFILALLHLLSYLFPCLFAIFIWFHLSIPCVGPNSPKETMTQFVWRTLASLMKIGFLKMIPKY